MDTLRVKYLLPDKCLTNYRKSQEDTQILRQRYYYLMKGRLSMGFWKVLL